MFMSKWGNMTFFLVGNMNSLQLEKIKSTLSTELFNLTNVSLSYLTYLQ